MPWPRGGAPIALALDPADAARDESLDHAFLVDDPQRGVLGTHELAHAIDDELEDAIERQHARDGPRGGIDRLQAVGGVADLDA